MKCIILQLEKQSQISQETLQTLITKSSHCQPSDFSNLISGQWWVLNWALVSKQEEQRSWQGGSLSKGTGVAVGMERSGALSQTSPAAVGGTHFYGACCPLTVLRKRIKKLSKIMKKSSSLTTCPETNSEVVILDSYEKNAKLTTSNKINACFCQCLLGLTKRSPENNEPKVSS